MNQQLQRSLRRSPRGEAIVDYTRIFDRVLTREDRQELVAIYGNQGPARYGIAIAIVEEIFEKEPDQTVMVVSTSDRWNGLFTPKGDEAFGPQSYVTFGRDVHGFTITSNDGAGIARHTLSNGISSVTNLDHLIEPHALARFLLGMVTAINDMTDANATIVLDIFQAMSPRQRHIVDGQAISALNLLMQTAYDKNVSVIGTATSPNDIPIEFRNSMATRILTTATEKTQIRAIDGLTDCGIKANALNTNGGISFSGQDEAWIVPGHNAHPDQLLRIGIPAARTGAGPRGVKHPKKSAVQDVANKAVLASRPKNKKSKKGGKAPKAAVQTSITATNVVPEDTSNPMMNALRMAGIGYYVQATSIINALQRMAGRAKTDDTSERVKDAVEFAQRTPTLQIAGKWMHDNKKKFGRIASPGVVGAAYTIALEQDHPKALRFFEALINPKGPSALLTALSNMQVAQLDVIRLKTILDAWNLHLVSTAGTTGGIAANA
jgi:hypothetical protein